MLTSNIRVFLKKLRDPSLDPYDTLSNGHTLTFNANEYIHWKLKKVHRSTVKESDECSHTRPLPDHAAEFTTRVDGIEPPRDGLV